MQSEQGESALEQQRRLMAEGPFHVEQDHYRGQDTIIRAELLAALKFAANFIADCQQIGVPAGPIAVPSQIRDAIAKAEGTP